jgi:hypothetical protein
MNSFVLFIFLLSFSCPFAAESLSSYFVAKLGFAAFGFQFE